MGWDTQINILVENIRDEEVEIAKDLLKGDAESYYQNGISFIKYRVCEDGSKVLFFTYERRKYLPHWTIQEVSKKFNTQYFTVIGSSPEFIGGPAGLVKIENGIILDSYGMAARFGDHSATTEIFENPNPEVLFQCFGKNKLEESIRELYLENHPKRWIDEAYSENIIEFTKEEMEKFNDIVSRFKDEQNTWIELSLNLPEA